MFPRIQMTHSQCYSSYNLHIHDATLRPNQTLAMLFSHAIAKLWRVENTQGGIGNTTPYFTTVFSSENSSFEREAE